MKNIFRISSVIILSLSFIFIHSCKKDKPTLPVISTTTITAISYTTATSGGEVTNEGGSPVTARGICWNTSIDPTISNNKTTESGGLGTFTSNLTQLTPNTLYYIRAYATNRAGTVYGNQVSFTTSPLVIPPTITGFTPKNGTMGSQITITGTHFKTEISGNTVKINDLVVVVTNASDGELNVIVPEGAITGKISLTIGETTTTTTDDFTVTDFENRFVVRGLYVQFDRRGVQSGYYTGQVIKDLNNFESSLGHTVADEVRLQLDEMKKIGVNTIVLELRTSEPGWTGSFDYPVCNLHEVLGLTYPVPTQSEIINLLALFDIIHYKQIKIMLRLVNTHMEEQPPLNNTQWLSAILNVVKNHPALDLVLFEGNTHLIDSNGDGIKDQCGIPAEPPLWLGPSSVPAKYVKWAIQYGMTLGLPANKVSAECVVGNYIIDSEFPSGPDATDRHLWRTVKVLKQIFDDLAIPENQRTYPISFYLQRKCENPGNIPCVDADPAVWAEETWKNVFKITGRKNSRVVAVEMGLSKNDPNWTTEKAFETHIKLIKRYGVAGGCFWRWVFFDDNEKNDPTLSSPVKKRGLTFEYNAVKDMMAQYYLGQ
ncbi:MAG: IPT/TIG domain-containing protein [Bacteroidia bacterium]|nr:IPT/TIG domain-containing protein [Bacteroidia bacterium]